MHWFFEISSEVQHLKPCMDTYTTHFSTMGNIFIKGGRNILKYFKAGEYSIIIKSFQRPNIINRVVYKYFRRTKAYRSYHNSLILISKNISAAPPLAYYEHFDFYSLRDSYYISVKLETDFVLWDIFLRDNFRTPENINILRQLASFVYKLHENGVNFKDLSPGNILLKWKGDPGEYDFYLVDVNRMTFHTSLSYKERIKNLRRLFSEDKYTIAIFSRMYGELYHVPPHTVYRDLYKEIKKFNFIYRLRHALKFWKKRQYGEKL